MPSPSAYFRGVLLGAPSVKLQLLLWAYIHGEQGVGSILYSLEPSALIALDDDGISSLLWVIADAGLDRVPNGRWLAQADIDSLNSWASSFVEAQPRRMMLTLMASARASGRATLSEAELRAIDVRVRDPEIVFHIAGKMMDDGRHFEAHGMLVEAFENGRMSALLGLADLEFNHFPGCEDRGTFYAELSQLAFSPRFPEHSRGASRQPALSDVSSFRPN